jgi:hypothetical protein
VTPSNPSSPDNPGDPASPATPATPAPPATTAPATPAVPSAITAAFSLEAAELVYQRLLPAMEALREDELSIVNTDVGTAASVAFTAASRITPLREKIVALGVDGAHVDRLVDYAQLTWYMYSIGAPLPPSTNFDDIVRESTQLRAKLFLWGTPLAAEGLIDPVHFERLRAGSGHKDTASDLVALVALYRSRWDRVQHLGTVTDADLTRAAKLGSILWGLASARENETTPPTRDASNQRIRRAWTLLDRAYTECRRALQFIRFHPGDADDYAPSLRRNLGPSARKPPSPASPNVAFDAPPAAPSSTRPLGGTGSPFITLDPADAK